ncbi:L-seryl-tRNA(Sec) selenium transferase [Oleidesulfovibrio sp.]|uniref:L-seryl-tRNA(Sec) selenium transferase n=1 Tax=Oleidesulfovibrio sp. TaxID=2909707 RepID=UPI003A8A887C
MNQLFRALPSVDAVLHALTDTVPAGAQSASTAKSATRQPLNLAALPRPMLREHVNAFLNICREEIRAGVHASPESLGLEALMPRLCAYVQAQSRPRFRRVLNGTGVVVHTNLGRSLLAAEATKAVAEACAHYSNLEFDLSTGERGSRYSHVEDVLKSVTGAEAGLVVNNNAAAVLLVLDTLCKNREVIVSRGQLVEIGGSFRIPDVMTRSGAILHEVGATNRTHLKDYEAAINENTAALLRVHTSNYRILGFHKEVALDELCELGRRHNLPVIEDLGSGVFYDFTGLGLGHEPTVQQVVADGADVVTFSGDKVLGGPQAGIIVGRKEFIDRIKKNPMNRALRIDKMTLAALEATLRLYMDMDKATREVPTLAMILAKPEELARRARRLAMRLRKALGDAAQVTQRKGASRVGGGSFPERDLPTTLVCIRPAALSATELKACLLDTDPPLAGMLLEDAFCLDPRTLADNEFALVTNALSQALTQA